MKIRFIPLLSLLLLLAACGRPQGEAPAPLIHATYSVYSRLVPEEMCVDQLKNYQYYYFQAMPSWKPEEFDAPLEDILREKVDNHQYSDGAQETIDRYIGLIHEAGNQIYLSFSGTRASISGRSLAWPLAEGTLQTWTLGVVSPASGVKDGGNRARFSLRKREQTFESSAMKGPAKSQQNSPRPASRSFPKRAFSQLLSALSPTKTHFSTPG